LAFQAIDGIEVTTPVLRFAWHTPDLLLAGMGFAAPMRHHLLTRAYQYAPALFRHCSAISTVLATILGWAVFGDLRSALTWTGAVVIVAGGIYIGFRERKTDAAEGGRVLGSDQSA
jgi:drug/metabolite transporter (DMT)-like permease